MNKNLAVSYFAKIKIVISSQKPKKILGRMDLTNFSTLASDFFACTDFGSDESAFTVTEQQVFIKLSKVNPAKANGPAWIPSWVPKENVDLLADPVKEILNLSYTESYLPLS